VPRRDFSCNENMIPELFYRLANNLFGVVRLGCID
jgi:hypothetical protein